VGGGLIIVPVLVYLWQAQGMAGESPVQLAIGTSLATIVLTSLSSIWSHHRHGNVQWPIFWRLVPGIVLGAWLGAAIATGLPGAALKRLFGVFELLMAAQMAFAVRPAPHRALPGTLGMGLAGTVIGSVAAIVGIGGGVLTVPFLTWCNVRIQQAVATSAACGLPIAVGGALAYVVLGWGQAQLPAGAAGYVYGPALLGIAITSVLFAPLGAAWSRRLSTAVLRRVFAVFLALLGLWMLLA
jgi:hypothetical protein